MENTIEYHHLLLNRDFLRTYDNFLYYLDQFHIRHNNNSYWDVNNFTRNRFNRVNRWSRRRPRTGFFDRNFYNSPSTLSSMSTPPPSTIIPPIPPPPPPPPPPSFNISNETTLNRNNSTNTRSLFNNDLTNFINNTLYTPTRLDYPTYNQVVNATTELTFENDDEDSNSQTRCPICQEDFEEGDTILKINYCGHIFKKDSLLTWFETNSRCPICRYDIRNDTIDVSNNIVDISNNIVDISNNVLNPDNQVNIFDLSGSNLTDILNSNISNVLETIGTNVINNLGTSVEQAIQRDLSGNNVTTAQFEYSFHLPNLNLR